MNDIEHNKAQCWCNRLHKLMKEKNYTQKSFLKEYKEKYGGGTQANISRWLRVGSKIENGKTIGFPSYETMSNLADFFGEYKSAFRYILTASSFSVFIKEVREYAENVYRLKHPIKYMDIVSAKMRKDLFDLAVKCMDYQCISDDKYGRIDDFEENSVEPTEELLEAIRILNDAQDQDYAQYELQKIYFEVIKELTKEEHLLDMVIPMYVEKDLINKG